MIGEGGDRRAFGPADKRALQGPDLARQLAAISFPLLEHSAGFPRIGRIHGGSHIDMMVGDQGTHHACSFGQAGIEHSLDLGLGIHVGPDHGEEPDRTGGGEQDGEKPEADRGHGASSFSR
ncbi:hypothetical protein D3C72_1899460 [compost metagenome]